MIELVSRTITVKAIMFTIMAVKLSSFCNTKIDSKNSEIPATAPRISEYFNLFDIIFSFRSGSDDGTNQVLCLCLLISSFL